MAFGMSAVHFIPESSRPWYDPSSTDEIEPSVSVLSLTSPFFYVIPNFDVLQVELRHMRVKGYDSNGEEQVYDLFIRNDPSLC